MTTQTLDRKINAHDKYWQFHEKSHTLPHPPSILDKATTKHSKTHCMFSVSLSVPLSHALSIRLSNHLFTHITTQTTKHFHLQTTTFAPPPISVFILAGCKHCHKYSETLTVISQITNIVQLPLQAQ